MTIPQPERSTNHLFGNQEDPQLRRTSNQIPRPKKSPLSEATKIAKICKKISELGYNPKSFLNSYLHQHAIQYNSQRRFWGTAAGWRTTETLLKSIKRVVTKKNARIIVASQKPPSGYFPDGAYHSTRTVSRNLFSKQAKDSRALELVKNQMPFLFNLIFDKLHVPDPEDDIEDSDDETPSTSTPIPVEELSEDSHLSNEKWTTDKEDSHAKRAHTTAKTICSMIAFVANRRHNGDQLANSLTFLAAGVTDRVNSFLYHVGLSSSRVTAHRALNHLSGEGKKIIASKLSKSMIHNIGPILCIDNLDFEQRIHTKSLGNTSRMFHGTWGYVHHPHPQLLSSVSQSDLTFETYRKSMADCADFDVHPKMLLPSPDEEIHFEAVLKSQIAQAILDYIATPADSRIPIKTHPPIIDQISHEKPDITMLKLMVASDNSAQGVSEVLEGIAAQSNLTTAEFSSRLQIIDGDLGTCTNFASLRSQRVPSKHKDESLSNILTILGAAHTMWNISQAIYLKHFGNSKDARDSGSWRFLDSLGVPSNKMLDKNDFTLMIKNMEKIQKASLVYAVMVVMGIERESLNKDLRELSSTQIHEIIEETYDRFCSYPARITAQNCPKKLNFILRLYDFASVVEANSSLKCGDIGRLMNIWKRWSITSQGVKKLTNYSIQLPRMVILLNEVLPPGLRRVILHSMLVSPSGSQKHFVAKDQYLEIQNYWLKYFFNHSGRGTNIDRLKDIYSLNVPLLQGLIRGLTSDSGKILVYQSHHNDLTTPSLNNCLRMCRINDVCAISSQFGEYTPEQVEDFYEIGINKIREMHAKKKRLLNKFRPPPIVEWNANLRRNEEDESESNSDVSSKGDEEPDISDEDKSAEESNDSTDKTDNEN